MDDLLILFEKAEISPRENQKSFILDCPECGKRNHCYVRKESGFAKCFKCLASWNFYSLAAALMGVRVSDVEKRLGQASAEMIPDPWPKKREREDDLPSRPILLGMDFVPAENSDAALSYLLSRGMTPEKMVYYDVRYHAAMHAVVFPIVRDGITYGWQARRIPPLKDEKMRLLTMAGVDKGRFLLNWDRASKHDRIVLVEGPFDCVKADQPGYGAVASMGKGVSDEQVNMILSVARQVYIGVDKDATEQAEELCSRFLQAGVEVYRLLPPDGRGDMGECTDQEAQEALEKAERVWDSTFLIEA